MALPLGKMTLLSLIKNVCNCLTENLLQLKKKLHFLFFFLDLAPFNHLLIHFHSMYKYLLMLGKQWGMGDTGKEAVMRQSKYNARKPINS